MIVKIEAIIPFRDEVEEIDFVVKELIEKLYKLSGKISIPLDDFGSANLNISVVKPPRVSKFKEKYPKYFDKSYIEVMSFKASISFEELFEYDLKDLPDFVTNESMNKSYLVGLYQSRFLNFLIFTQLALPGSLYSHKGFYLVDDELDGMEIYPFSSNLVGWTFLEDKENWPFFKKLKIKQVWDYIVNKTELLTTSSKSNIENGLSAFTYLIDEDINFANSLFWAMSGIEALYVEGDIGIGYQIDKKSKVFLGEPIENKKVLKELYNYRSKFLHGRMSIPINHGWIQEGNDVDKHEEGTMDMAYIASKLLISTLQEIIIKGLEEFKFDFYLK